MKFFIFTFTLGLAFISFPQILYYLRRPFNPSVAEFRSDAEKRIRPYFQAAGVSYPPARVLLVYTKEPKEFRLYAANARGERWRMVKNFRVEAASGEDGPKLRSGDKQVPEGIYRIESLNPKSQFHVALRVSYPNAFDRARAEADGRTNLGGDIMIHGEAASIGCVALGNEPIEELFVTAQKSRFGEWKVLLSPVDFRKNPEYRPRAGQPEWVADLYQNLRREFAEIPLD